MGLTVDGDEHRGTAWLVSEPDQTVRLTSLRARLNHHPAPELLVAVRAWIDAHNQAARDGRLAPVEWELLDPGASGPRLWTRDWRRLGPLDGIPMEDADLDFLPELGDLVFDDMPF